MTHSELFQRRFRSRTTPVVVGSPPIGAYAVESRIDGETTGGSAMTVSESEFPIKTPGDRL
jgi:hypothetical protein